MLCKTILQASLLLAGAGVALARPSFSPINARQVQDVQCTDPNTDIDFHDENVAILSICGGIAGTIQKCGGAPESTVGESGTARFSLNAVEEGATINISKGRWERCIKAARETCPTGTMQGTCEGGASSGDVAFTLESP